MYYQAAAAAGVTGIGLTMPGGGIAFLVARVLLIVAGALFASYALTLIVLTSVARGRRGATVPPPGVDLRPRS